VKVTFSDCDRAGWVLGHAREHLKAGGNEEARSLLRLAQAAVEAEQDLLAAVGWMTAECEGYRIEPSPEDWEPEPRWVGGFADNH